MATYATNLHQLKAQAQSRALDQAKRKLARHLSPPVAGLQNRQPVLTRRWAQVAAVNSNGTVTLTMDGTTVANIACLSSYSPIAGDPVILDILGSDPVVIGTTATTARAGGGVPTGALLDYAGGTVPVGYLLCDGSAVSRTTYASLFAKIGTTWGAGDGTTTFNLPDLRGRGSIGSGTGSGLTARTLGTHGGEETHVLSLAELASHSHSHNHSGTSGGESANHSHGYTFNMRDYDFGAIIKSRGDWAAGDTTTTLTTHGITTSGVSGDHTHTTTVNTDATGAGSNSGHNTMQPFAVVTKIIKT